MAKLRVALLYGGRSVEHEVSLASAASVRRALDPSRYEVWPVGVTREGRWRAGPPGTALETALAEGRPVAVAPAPGGPGLLPLPEAAEPIPIDVVFPLVHGQGGEDGSLQGLLDLAGIPYVGAGVLGSALQMDKEVSKRLLAAAGVPVAPWVAIRKADLAADPRGVVAQVRDALPGPWFVKPACTGSSVGITRVGEGKKLGRALAEASRYDEKLVVEQAIDAREIEVAVLGNHEAETSVPGEIRPKHEFYDYEAKYVDEATELLVPAPVDEATAAEARRLAALAYRVLEGAGLARIDFLLERGRGRLLVSEANSLPGFTDASMYPRLWEATGLPYAQLLDRLIELGLERHRARARLETTYRRS